MASPNRGSRAGRRFVSIIGANHSSIYSKGSIDRKVWSPHLGTGQGEAFPHWLALHRRRSYLVWS